MLILLFILNKIYLLQCSEDGHSGGVQGPAGRCVQHTKREAEIVQGFEIDDNDDDNNMNDNDDENRCN